MADLTAFVRVMDEQQEARLKRLSTSQQHEQPSRPQLDDDEEQDRRDREDTRRRRIAAEQQRSLEAARRVVSAPVGLGCALDDDEDREAARDDGPEFG